MTVFYSDESLLLNPLNQNDLANKYICNENVSYKFSQENGVSSDKLFKTRYKIALNIKKERLKPYLSSAVSYMSADERKYWQSLYSELFLAELYQYNFYIALNRKQLLGESEANLVYYQSQLKHLESFDEGVVNAPESQELWRNNTVLFEYLKVEGYFSPAQWCQNVLTKICIAWNAFLRDSLDELNWYRLYWVWAGGAGGFLGSILDLEPVKTWHGRDLASARLESPDFLCGYASWALYATRLSLHSALTAKHVIPNPFMSDVEKEVDWQTRLITQVEQRYQRMGNDIAWGYVNYASAYWYSSALSPTLGAWGGFLNVALMSWDCLMAYIKLSVEADKYKTAKKAIEDKISRLEDLVYMDVKIKERAIIALKQDLKILETNWKYDKQELTFILSLAFAFIPAMALMFMPMFPIYFPALVISSALMTQLIFIGCLASVLLTAYETYYCANLAIDKSFELMNAAIEKMQLLKEVHNQLITQERELQPSELDLLRQYHLENKRLMLEIKYLKDEQSYHQLKMFHSISIQFAFPAVVFGSLFVAITPAIILIASALLVALVTKLMVDANKPKEIDEFANKEEEGYTKLCLTEDEFNNPKQGFFEEKLKKNNNLSKTKEDKLGVYGLFATNHKFVPLNASPDLGLAM